MRLLLLLISVLVLQTGCGGVCDPPVRSIDSGTYQRRPGSSYGEWRSALGHPGAVEWMEVDREADLVRLHGVTDDGESFVETYRITKATSN